MSKPCSSDATRVSRGYHENYNRRMKLHLKNKMSDSAREAQAVIEKPRGHFKSVRLHCSARQEPLRKGESFSLVLSQLPESDSSVRGIGGGSDNWPIQY
jgi:hypothetical protein